MPLQLEKFDELPQSKLIVNVYPMSLQGYENRSVGRIKQDKKAIDLSNLTALVQEKNSGLNGGMVALIIKLLHEETLKQIREGRRVEVFGIGTAYLGCKGKMKTLNPSPEDVPNVVMKFKASRTVQKLVKPLKIFRIERPRNLPMFLPEIVDLKTHKIQNIKIKKDMILQFRGTNLKVEGESSDVGFFILDDEGHEFKIYASDLLINENKRIVTRLHPSMVVGKNYTFDVRKQKKYKGKWGKVLYGNIGYFVRLEA